MKVFFETSVLVAALVEAHPMHARALPWLERAQGADFDGVVSSHTVAEVYAVLTALPLRPRITPTTAWRLIQESVLSAATIVALSASDYTTVLKRVSKLGLSGGVVYDALAARAAQKSRAGRFLTFNSSDFERVWPEGKSLLYEP
jgi:predicted nucleic acid-binding protein